MSYIVRETSGAMTIHLEAADDTRGYIDLAVDVNGNPLWRITNDGDMYLKASLIEEAILELGEDI